MKVDYFYYFYAIIVKSTALSLMNILVYATPHLQYYVLLDHTVTIVCLCYTLC